MRTTPYYIYARVRSVLRMPLLSVLLFLFSCLPSDVVSQDFGLFTQSAPCPKRELRAVWVTTLNGLDWPKTHATSAASRAKQQQELCQLLDQLKAININTVLLQTRVRGSVIYPSAIEPWDVALTGTYGGDPGYDPLEFAIQETHRRGMELHAWVVTIPCFKVAVAPKMGSRSVLKTHPELCRRHSDTYYLDPGLPGSADYLQRICHEIVSRYDVDGIHFDYIRYPEGASSFNDGETFRKYASRGQTKAAWRRNNITRIVRRIYNDVHQLKPWVRVSSSPVGKYADVTRFSSRGWNARDAVHQDAQGWLRQGIHDILFPMMYFDGDHFYPFAADWQEQKFGRNVAPGLGIYFLHPQEKNWPLEVIIRQLHYLRSQELDGQAYFRSKFLTDNVKGLYKYLQQDFYAFPALPPACPWLSTSLPPAPAELSVEPCSGFSELRWQAPADNLRYNVYASSTWPVDVTSAQNMIAVLLPEPHFVFSPLQMAFSHLHLAVTSMDRFGNESIATQLSASPDAIPSPKLFDSRGRMKDFIHRPMTTAEQKERNQGKTKRK
ncbi:MAG: family 10 glycosylhydrolase [Bacteroidaceae bacterium]|nr:family 10 glycosylhydrolase [Bacteroidaceae bacterium]